MSGQEQARLLAGFETQCNAEHKADTKCHEETFIMLLYDVKQYGITIIKI